MVRHRRNIGISTMPSRPGSDSRIWLSLAVVKDIAFDPDEGVFVDIQLQPTGEEETAYLGGPYAGDGFGFHCPVAVNDTILVAMPGGDPGNGPIIVARINNSGDPPPADFGNGEEAVEDVIFRVRPGRKIKIRTSDDGDGVDILVEGNGDLLLKTAGTGLVKIQDADQEFVRGSDLKSALESFADQVQTAFSNLVVPAPPTTPVTGAQSTAANTTITAAVVALKAAAQNYLSSKIKGS